MKPRLLARGFLLSLSYNYYPAQNRLLRLLLESGKPLHMAEQLIPQVLKTDKVFPFIDAITRSISLNDREKSMIKAKTFYQLGLYEKAWESMKTVSSAENDILSFKEKVLYQMRNVEEYLILHDEYKFISSLSEEEKNEFLVYALLKSNQTKRLKLAKALESMNDLFLYHADGVGRTIDFDKEYLRILSKNERLHVLSSLLQRYEDNVEEYKKLVHDAISFEQNESPFLPKHTFIEDLFNAEKALENNESLVAFHKLIEAYEKGERSFLLHHLLLLALKQHTLTNQHERLARLINNGYVDLMSHSFIDVLKVQESYISLFKYVAIEKLTNDHLNQFLNTINESNVNKKRIVESLINAFYHYDYNLPLSIETFMILDQLISQSPVYAVVKGKWLIDKGETETLPSVVDISDKKYWVYMQLIDYAFEKEKYGLSLELANKASELRSFDPFLIRKLASIHHRIGNLREKMKYLKQLRAMIPGAFKTEYQIAKDEVLLDTEMWAWNGNPEQIQGESGVLHVLNKSLPEINGYTIRSKEIVHHQRNLDLHPIVVTKLGWPAKPKVGNLECETIDGVQHFRLHTPKNKVKLNVVPLSEYFTNYANEFLKLLQKVRPKVVHAASNFQNALPALEVAKKAGIPTVYEVRGLWQDSTASKIPEFDESERYYMQQKYELYCCKIADRVVAIGDSLAEHLVRLGVDRNKIDIVPNGVDVKVFYPKERSKVLEQKYNLEKKTVYGFIGSITKYEGLSDLLHAFALLKNEQPAIHFLLVGDGPALPQLRKLVKELQLSESVSVVGRVPHTEVMDYYSVIDIFPFPRINAKVCRLVTPLKPFEVMAMGKLAIVSNIPALNEMVKEGETGLVFEAENIESLKECMAKAPEFKEIGLKSREWVEQNRDWAILSKRYLDVYNKLII